MPLLEPGRAFDTGLDGGVGRNYQMSHQFVGTGDGQFLYRGGERGTDPAGYTVTRFDRDGQNPMALDTPAELWLKDVFPDGSLLLEGCSDDQGQTSPAYRWTPGDKKATVISGELYVHGSSPSPDGKTLLATSQHLENTAPPDGLFYKLVVIDLDTGEPTRIDGYHNTAHLKGFWSPDGQRVAAQWHGRVQSQSRPGGKKLVRCGGGAIAVMAADGSDPAGVMRLDDPGYKGIAAVSLFHRKHLIGWFPGEIKTS